jgi:CheY-like chemotaxis protein
MVMDVRMPGPDGLKATVRIRRDHPNVQVIVLTTYDLDEYVFRAIRASAADFFLKDGDAEELIRGVRAVHTGDALMVRRPCRHGSRRVRLRLQAPRDRSSNSRCRGRLLCTIPSRPTGRTHITECAENSGRFTRCSRAVGPYRRYRLVASLRARVTA